MVHQTSWTYLCTRFNKNKNVDVLQISDSSVPVFQFSLGKCWMTCVMVFMLLFLDVYPLLHVQLTIWAFFVESK